VSPVSLQESLTWRLGCNWHWNPFEVLEALEVLRHVDARWEMTTKQRLACGAAILRSIDALRQRTGNRNELLALEQAIVDRELIELVTGVLCDEKREPAGDLVRERYVPPATRDTGAPYEKDRRRTNR
jgi:hypothetical protein